MYTSLKARNLSSGEVKVAADVCGKASACSDVSDNDCNKMDDYGKGRAFTDTILPVIM